MPRSKKKPAEDKKVFNAVHVLGLSLGYWIMVALARVIKDIPLIGWDDDTFEGGMGSTRLPAMMNTKQTKADSVQGFIGLIMDDPEPRVVKSKLTPEIMDTDPTWSAYDWRNSLVVDSTDMADGPRRELWTKLQSCGATLIRVSYDGLRICVVSPSLPWAAGLDQGYAIPPDLPTTFMAAGMGAMAVQRVIETGQVAEVQFDYFKIERPQ